GRALGGWTETDVGRFHQWLSLLMAASAAALSVVALLEWAGRPGMGLLMVALLAATCVAARDARSVWRSPGAPEDDRPAWYQGRASWAGPRAGPCRREEPGAYRRGWPPPSGRGGAACE